MSLRSLLLLAVLFAASASAAQWSDIFVSYWLNATPVKMCAVDRPSVCAYVPKPPFENLDPRKTLVVAVYRRHASTLWSATLLTDYAMLQAVVRNTPAWAVVNVTRPGLLYSSYSFDVYSFSRGTRGSSSSYVVCNKTYTHAYWADAGLYNVSRLTPPLYWLDISTCISYRLVERVDSVANVTLPWYSLYAAALLPNTTKIYPDSYWFSQNLNGTRHAYRTYFHSTPPASPLGLGVYIANSTVVSTVVMKAGNLDGPWGYDALRNSTSPRPPYIRAVMYNIGTTYGDARLYAHIPTVPLGPRVKFTHIANGTAGYAVVNMSHIGPTTQLAYEAFFARYAVVEVAAEDFTYVYATRGVACPLALPAGGAVVYTLNRLDRVQEIEVCNNSTAAVVLALLHTSPHSSINQYFSADVVAVGKCARLRWDSSIASKPILFFFDSERKLCNRSHRSATTSYNVGWRHFYFANGTLRPVQPITPDAMYEEMWRRILEEMARMYNATANELQRWLQAQANASQSLQSLISSLPRFHGTIRMDSSTSVWLQTVLNELGRWHVPGPPSGGGGFSAGPPATPALTASAAAAAVATAWAASRRSLATAAFLAGFAILATALFTAALYGTTVTAALVTVGVMLMAVGAAAAWMRQTGEE